MENNFPLAQVKCKGMYQKLTLQLTEHCPLEGERERGREREGEGERGRGREREREELE